MLAIRQCVVGVVLKQKVSEELTKEQKVKNSPEQKRGSILRQIKNHCDAHEGYHNQPSPLLLLLLLRVPLTLPPPTARAQSSPPSTTTPEEASTQNPMSRKMAGL